MKTYMYLIDLERSVGSGFVCYWRPNRRGYTTEISEAGKYIDVEAIRIVQSDLDNTTVMIRVDQVEKIIKY
jgi:phosphoribosyl-AMP cyclohydrolase